MFRHISRTVARISLATLIAIPPVTAASAPTQFYGVTTGDPDAPVTLVVFQNFGYDGIVGQFYRDLIPEVLQAYIDDGRLRVEAYPVHYPSMVTFGIHCADEQGRGWPFNSDVYAGSTVPLPVLPEHIEDLSKSDLLGIAEGLGLNTERYGACVDRLLVTAERTQHGNGFALHPHPMMALMTDMRGFPVFLIGTTRDLVRVHDRVLVGPDFRNAPAELREAIETQLAAADEQP